MKKIDFGQAVTVIANLGVIAGIVFLAVEISQNTRSQEIGAYQNLMDQIIQLNRNWMYNPATSRLVRENFQSSLADLNEDDYEVMSSYILLLYRYGDLAFHQHERGTLSEERFESALGPLTDNVCSTAAREVWATYRQNFVPSYRGYVDGLVSECGMDP